MRMDSLANIPDMEIKSAKLNKKLPQLTNSYKYNNGSSLLTDIYCPQKSKITIEII